jgi:phage major head subunit gpT-like protein
MIGEAYESAADPILDQIATTVPMSTEILLQGWTGMLGNMRPWLGPRVTHEANPQTYSVASIPFEFTLTVDKFRLEDDQFGIYYRQIPDMARNAKRWPGLQLRNMLENQGYWTNNFQNGLDGLTNWNTAHLINLYQSSLGTYSNDFTGGGQTVNGVLVGGAFGTNPFKTLVEYMMTLKGEDNEVLGIMPNMLMCPPAIMGEVNTVLMSTFYAPSAFGTLTGQVGAADNQMRKYGVEPLVNSFLVSTNKWYLMDTTKPMKPFTWGLRMAPEFTQRTNENDPVVFDEHQYLWGNVGRGCPAWSFAWLCCRSGS